ncbi:uncharacterized protein N7496_004861 [Penicillium cataractarum]|uniref:Uncharacterized protein n=1 Tax=Penicillium cataractarum TaxID=2100454 RepID=A0A9W9SF32_9EURO|nr:uncharacterized protein N7496_004861 [Penicillium cataractarum]KAJ5377452.1 hypothetical protein N7496_004861 [Penicillium cataractarum]
MSTQQNSGRLEALDAKMKELIEAFEANPQITSPVPNPTAFFLFDFVKNTYNTLQTIDAARYASGDRQALDAIQEVTGRNQFTSVLINDSSGKLALMTGGDPSRPFDFGATIKAKAKELADI